MPYAPNGATGNNNNNNNNNNNGGGRKWDFFNFRFLNSRNMDLIILVYLFFCHLPLPAGSKREEVRYCQMKESELSMHAWKR
jgi:hypothetical protein